MNKEEANKVLSEKVAQAMALVRECEQLAKDNDLSFSFDVAYGMGGEFCHCEYKDCYTEHDKDSKFGWHASSQNC